MEGNWNVLVGVDEDRIFETVKNQTPEVGVKNDKYFGSGRAAEEMVGVLRGD